MSGQQNKAIIRRLFEQTTAGDPADVDDLVSPDFVFHDPADAALGGGPAGFRRWLARSVAAIPDGRLTIEEQIAEGDRVVTRFTVRGTAREKVLGVPARGQLVVVTGIQIGEVSGGKLVGHRDEVDLLGLVRQLGAAPRTSAGQAPTLSAPAGSDAGTGGRARPTAPGAPRARIAAHVAGESAALRPLS